MMHADDIPVAPWYPRTWHVLHKEVLLVSELVKMRPRRIEKPSLLPFSKYLGLAGVHVSCMIRCLWSDVMRFAFVDVPFAIKLMWRHWPHIPFSQEASATLFIFLFEHFYPPATRVQRNGPKLHAHFDATTHLFRELQWWLWSRPRPTQTLKWPFYAVNLSAIPDFGEKGMAKSFAADWSSTTMRTQNSFDITALTRSSAVCGHPCFALKYLA